jgi:hypothetical protein
MPPLYTYYILFYSSEDRSVLKCINNHQVLYSRKYDTGVGPIWIELISLSGCEYRKAIDDRFVWNVLVHPQVYYTLPVLSNVLAESRSVYLKDLAVFVDEYLARTFMDNVTVSARYKIVAKARLTTIGRKKAYSRYK